MNDKEELKFVESKKDKEKIPIDRKIKIAYRKLDNENEEIENEIQQLKKLIEKNNEIQGAAKELLKKYKSLNNRLENTYMYEAKRYKDVFELIKNKFSDDVNSRNIVVKSIKVRLTEQNKRIAEIKKYIDMIEPKLKEISENYAKLSKKKKQKKELKTIKNKHKIFNDKIQTIDQLMKKLIPFLQDARNNLSNMKSSLNYRKNAATNTINEILEIQKELEKITEQTGGGFIHDNIIKYNINYDNFLHKITNPLKLYINNTKFQKGGTKNNIKHKYWILDSPKFIFKDFKRKELEKIAKNLGIINTKKYKNKNSLAKALKIIYSFHGGSLENKKNVLKTVAHNLDINTNKYTKNQLQKLIKRVSEF